MIDLDNNSMVLIFILYDNNTILTCSKKKLACSTIYNYIMTFRRRTLWTKRVGRTLLYKTRYEFSDRTKCLRAKEQTCF